MWASISGAVMALLQGVAALFQMLNRRDARQDAALRRKAKERDRDAFEADVDEALAGKNPSGLGGFLNRLRRLRSTTRKDRGTGGDTTP